MIVSLSPGHGTNDTNGSEGQAMLDGLKGV